jgi:hypothetical protein
MVSGQLFVVRLARLAPFNETFKPADENNR